MEEEGLRESSENFCVHGFVFGMGFFWGATRSHWHLASDHAVTLAGFFACQTQFCDRVVPKHVLPALLRCHWVFFGYTRANKSSVAAEHSDQRLPQTFLQNPPQVCRMSNSHTLNMVHATNFSFESIKSTSANNCVLRPIKCIVSANCLYPRFLETDVILLLESLIKV